MSGAPGRGTGPRPHTWKVGSDPVLHDQYTAWLKARSQAWFRKEDWQLTFQDWVDLWGTNWSRRGREVNCLMLMRRRWQEPWTKRNCHLVDRPTFHARQAKIKAERKILRSKDDGSKV